MRTETLAVVFTDIKGYTATTARQSHQENARMLRRVERVVSPVVRAFSGRVIKSIGDAYMIVFRSPTEAVRCAMAIQDRLSQHNAASRAGEELHIRIAINVGEVRVHRGDVFGEPVNVASRIEGVTPADEVYFSEAVYLTMNRSDAAAERVGEYELKGITEPVTVYRVKKETPEEKDGGEERRPRGLPFGGKQLEQWRRMRWVRRASLAMWVLVVAGLLGSAYLRFARRTDYEGVIAAMKTAVEEKRPVDALSLANQIPEGAVQEHSLANSYRRRAIHMLLQEGDLVTAGREVAMLLKLNPHDAEALVLSAMLQLQGGESADEAMQALERAVELEPTLAELESFVGLVVQGYADGKARKIADRIVTTTLKDRAVPVLRRALNEGRGDRLTQNSIAARLEKLGAGDDVDWVALAIEDLKSTSCKMRKAAIARLVTEQDERGVGPLMKLAALKTCGSSQAGSAAQALLAK